MHRTIQTCKSAIFTLLLAMTAVVPLACMPAQPAAAATVCPAAHCYEAKLAPTLPCSNLNKCDLIKKYVNPLVNFLTALVGVAVVVSIIIGGIQYSSSEGDPGKASAAKNRIRNAIIALIAFILLYAMLNFLIPGGLI